jgi:predicted transcriptional regulator
MMSERRSKLEIMLKVLTAIRDGETKPTRIMYAANMSWNPTQQVLAKLVGEDLIRVTEKPGNKRMKKRYELTEKGLNVLRYFEGARALVNI